MSAWITASRRLLRARLVKYDTVIGTIGNTHGVSSDNAPINAASPTYAPSVEACSDAAMSMMAAGARATPAAVAEDVLLAILVAPVELVVPVPVVVAVPLVALTPPVAAGASSIFAPPMATSTDSVCSLSGKQKDLLHVCHFAVTRSL